MNLLSYSIESILIQDRSKIPFELIIVDNGSSDSTKELIFNFRKNSSIPIFYFFEKKIGLSYARNSGAEISNYPYLIFIDDDGLIRKDFLSVFLNVVNNFDFDCFGGWYVPMFLVTRPKWLDDKFGYYPKWLDFIGSLELGKDVPGGILVIKKNVLLKVGGFPTHLGMRGGIVSFGEENFVQNKIRRMGGKIGFVPDMILDHIVGNHKLKLTWHLHMKWAKGRDHVLVNGKINFKDLIISGLKGVVYPFPLFIYNFVVNLPKKGFYLGNLVLNTFSYPFYCLGKVYGYYKLRNEF